MSSMKIIFIKQNRENKYFFLTNFSSWVDINVYDLRRQNVGVVKKLNYIILYIIKNGEGLNKLLQRCMNADTNMFRGM